MGCPFAHKCATLHTYIHTYIKIPIHHACMLTAACIAHWVHIWTSQVLRHEELKQRIHVHILETRGLGLRYSVVGFGALGFGVWGVAL